MTAEQYFKAWNTCCGKLIFNIPRSTYTYLVEDFFARNHVTLRNQVLSRYPNFFQSLLISPSKEVQLLANLVSRDPRSNTYTNIQYITSLSGLNPWDYSAAIIKASLPTQNIPSSEQWRIGLLDLLLKLREKKEVLLENSFNISAMIDSLCCT